jgi:nicotinamidase/pyrazinamidase
MKVSPDEALLLEDVQVDFCPGGALAVAEGDRVVPVLNRWIAAFEAARRPIFASRDWHPPDHCSFRSRGGPWPPHGVAGSAGAAFHPDLRLPAGAHVVSKATSPDAEAYSTFQGTDFERQLRRLGVRGLVVGGLATDYCVLESVLDARRLGFAVRVPLDAVRAVDVHPGDGERAIARMRAAGAEVIESSEPA